MLDISAPDILLILFLGFLEALLSIDNALVLAIMAGQLPRKLQTKALTYGLVGSVAFRLAMLCLAAELMHWRWAKILGGAYLLFISARYFLYGRKGSRKAPRTNPSFWQTVVMIELVDVAFAVDSVLAAVALTPKLWIVFLGGMLGVIVIRFAATQFIVVLRRFPKFERTAFELVALVGIKLLVDVFHLPNVDFNSPSSLAFWVFWGAMLATILAGFRLKPS
jgi:YkoY family integral membrane protein